MDACVPVTALKIFDWEQRNFVIQGQGPFARIIEDVTGDVIDQARVFQRSNVHGFVFLAQRPHQDGRIHIPVIAWGDQSIRALDLFLGPQDSVTFSLSSAEFLSPDWIMSGCAGADEADTAYLITANNALLGLRIQPAPSSSHHTTIKLNQLATSVKSILYAADLIPISRSHVLITAGTAFGEIIVWSCFIAQNDGLNVSATASIHHFFTGHDGSIFGVRISPRIPLWNREKSGRVFASCSDDRTVRIWDISDCEFKSSQDPSAYSTDGFELRSTGFGSVAAGPGARPEACVAKAFGHISRIWGVDFRPLISDRPSTLGLVTRGEDGHCVLWDLSWQSSSPGLIKYELRQVSSLRRHSGKHIWSLSLCARGKETVVYTGGADGALNSFIVDEVNLLPPPTASKNVVGQSKVGLKSFAFVDVDCFLACLANNEICIGSVGSASIADIMWESLCSFDDLRPSAVMAGIPSKGLALVGNSQGRIRLYNHRTRSFSDLVERGPRILELLPLEIAPNDVTNASVPLTFLISHPTDEQTTLISVAGWNTHCPKVETFSLNLPLSPYNVSSACLTHDGEFLLVGSKLGGLALYRVAGDTRSREPLIVNRRVHGHAGTNMIQLLTSTATKATGLEYVMSCGRDGTYCLHEIHTGKTASDTVSLETIHQTPSGVDGNLEGMYIDKTTGDLMIYGFRSQSFVLRNESRQADVISIDSGGARRLWAFHPGVAGKKEALFLWKEGINLHTRRIRPDLTRSLRIGGHGREIKTMGSFDAPKGRRSFFATGAEDTAVRIFALSSPPNAGPWGSFESCRDFDTHTTGIQQVTWSKDGQYLFTSGAYEELYAWRVRWVPSFGIAIVLVAPIPKEDPESELRITSFDVLEVTESDSSRGFLLSLALSNSTIKIFHFSPAGDPKFTLLAKGQYMTNCLTEAHLLLRDSSLSLVTAATDGHVTIWDLTNTLESSYIIEASKLTLKGPLGGPSVSPKMISCESRYQIHLNSIKTMQTIPLSDSDTLIVTGGDDNSLAVSFLKTSPGTGASNGDLVSVSIPDAHAASVTASVLIDQQLVQRPGSNKQTVKLILASSGNDHRVKVWSIGVDPTEPDTKSISVGLLVDRYSSVADISTMGLVQDCENRNSQSHEARLLICGVGMEMLEISSK
ncbi:hypothetical protein N7492_002232 [Penicillium capsulatum]|uniref:WD repeat protein n=1 Tax=Penicillium capsulatum TaxID=69766 RepID=A0A9W9IJR1_9EURO|nr:hypothetical protein N7492_002232 [Penicillium capsulatum]KAJ6123162.1 hypothetical protein N7512_005627 [Penicillium capsulatum]